MISFLIHGLFRSLLFSFPIFEAHRYIFVDFGLITLRLESILCMFSIPYSFLRLVLSPSLWSALVSGECLPCTCEASVTAAVGWNAPRMSVKSRWLFRSVSLLVLCQLVCHFWERGNGVSDYTCVFGYFCFGYTIVVFCFVTLLVHVKIKFGIMCYLEEWNCWS